MKKSLLNILDQPVEKLARETSRMPNREALRLYRDILKFSKQLNWTNEHGQNWKDIIVQSSRKEFEIARDEKDSLMVMRMIVASREAIHNTKEKMAAEIFKHQQQVEYSRINTSYDSGYKFTLNSKKN